MRKVNKAGLNLIKSFEGCKLRAYQDSVGVWTIGYGHTQGVKRGDVITQQEADAIFEDDINIFAAGVDRLIEDDVNDNEFAALVSLAFNIGLRNFGRSSLLRLVNRGDFDSAANEFLKWNRAGGKVLKGLTRRRKAEKALFLTPEDILRAATVQAMQQSEPVASFSSSNGDATQPLESPPEQPIVAQTSQTITETKTTPEGQETAQTSILESEYLTAPKQVIKDNSGKLANWMIGGSVLGAIGGFLKDNAVLIVVFFVAAVVIGLSVYYVNKYFKLEEARIKADKNLHDVEFVKAQK